ncbi:MAG: hypothetical protein AB7G17_05495 [Phycisphaerales bacterium]
MRGLGQRALRALLTGGALLLCATWLGGCAIAELAGGMAESYKRSSTHEVKADYTGLTGKTFAVVVSVDRVVLSERPELAGSLIVAISERLKENTGASGYVQPLRVIEFMSTNPRWAIMTPADLMKEFGVDRLIYVEVLDFRLHEPGNRYLWDGLASATMGVLEAESGLADEYAFRRQVSVAFPDQKGITPTDLTENVVATRLQTRLVDRIVWVFYDHQEPYYPTY